MRNDIVTPGAGELTYEIRNIVTVAEKVRAVLDEHPGPVAQYLAGKTATLGFQATSYRVDPEVVGGT